MNIKAHYAWIIVFLTFLSLLTVQGVRLSFGAFVEPWEKEFSLNRGTVSLISTLSFLVYGFSQPVIGRLVDKFGPRLVLSLSTFLVGASILLTAFVHQPWQLFILYGIFVSIGVGGASNVAAAVMITNWFNEKRGIALGIVEAGFGAGQMLLVPGSLLLIQWMDWKGTVIVFGILLIVLVFPVIFVFLRNHPIEKGLTPVGGYGKEGNTIKRKDTNIDFSIWTIFRMKQFWFLILPFFVCGFTTTGLMDTHLISFAQLCGFTTSLTSVTVSVLAGFNIIGILISGILADHYSSRKMLFVLYIIRALSLVILLYSYNPILLIIFAVIFGLVDFATVAPTQLLATQYFRHYSVGFIIGWLFLSHQMGSALGAYLPGLVFSYQGNYDFSIYFSIVILVISAVLTLLLPEFHKKRGNSITV